jgi:hypothetical protein
MPLWTMLPGSFANLSKTPRQYTHLYLGLSRTTRDFLPPFQSQTQIKKA